MKRTAKLSPLATSTTELIDLVPLPHGRTHCPEESVSVQEEPTPLAGSYPAEFAKNWNRVIE